MLLVILLYDQLLFRPLVAWVGKFRFEQTAGASGRRSWVLRLLRRTRLLRLRRRRCIGGAIRHHRRAAARASAPPAATRRAEPSRTVDAMLARRLCWRWPAYALGASSSSCRADAELATMC